MSMIAPQEQQQQQPMSPQEAKEKIKEKGQEVKSQAGERVREQLQTRAQSAGEQAQSLSQSVRRVGSELRTQGQQSQATVLDQVAVRSEQLAGYLTQAEPDQLLSDARRLGSRATDFARQQPLFVAGIGLAVGLIGSRLASAIAGGQGS